jgi:hypothetical protein
MPSWKPRAPRIKFAMRYLVKARVKSSLAGALAKAIADGTLGLGSITGDEYVYDMQMARVDAKGDFLQKLKSL